MPPPQQQQGGTDNSLAPLWGIIAFFMLAGLLWYYFHTQIAWIVLKIRLWEAQIIAFFVPRTASLVPRLRNLVGQDLDLTQLMNISASVGRYLCYPTALFMLILGIIMYFSHINLRFRKYYTMSALVDAEQSIWPQIKPVVKLDLIKTDIDTGPWAMALSPLQFSKKHQLLQIERIPPALITATRPQTIAKIHHEKARGIFILQLGERWQGLEKLPLHTRALFSVFAARANRDRKGASQLLQQIAESSSKSHLNFSGNEALLRKHVSNKGVRRVASNHAYVLTMMASMLTLARQDGVLASADFLWLKPVDRTLWFMLNCVGRQTAFSEVAGPFAHWLAECRFGHALMAPMIEEAVNALEIALQEILYVDDE